MNWKTNKQKGPDWPAGADGEPVPPVFLTHIHGGPLDLELTLNLLTAYGIPYNNEYPNNGLFGQLLMGFPPGGMDVFVPETMLEDAQNILGAEVIETEDEGGYDQ